MGLTLALASMTGEQEPGEAEPSWSPDRFGSYSHLIGSPEFRFRDRHEGCQ